MYQFSKREKILIFIMIFLALIVGGSSIFIKPALDRMFELKEAVIHEELRKTEMETILNCKDELEIYADEQRELFLESVSGVYERMNEEETGQILMEVMDSSGVVSVNMSVERAKLIDIWNHETKEQINECIYSAVIGGRAVGKEDSVISFLNSISENMSMKIRDFTIMESDDKEYTLEYEVEIYMVDRDME